MTNAIEATGRIVVGTDFSHHADLAVDWAAERAERLGVGLLIVLSIPEVPIPRRSHLFEAMQEGDYVEHLHSRGAERLAEEEQRVRAARPTLLVETHVVEGVPSYVLARASKTAALVVVGARGRHAPARVQALGGTSDAVVAHAHCPVAVISDRTDIHHTGPVVVGVDDSPESLAAIRFAVEEAASRKVPIVALHAWDMGPWFATMAGMWSVDPQTMGADLGEMVDQLMAPYLAEHPDLQYSKNIVGARASVALLEASETASLIVLGSRGRGGFAGLLLGSTSKEVLREATCPVVIMRTEHTREERRRQESPPQGGQPAV